MTNTTSTVVTSFGSIRFETVRDGDRDLPLMAFVTDGKLVSSEGALVGECRFIVYRRKRNRSWMTTRDICYAMDDLSSRALQVGEAIWTYDECELEYFFNLSCLLVAERVEISPQFRGAGAWKALYFATMEKALEPLKHTPSKFFFKVFPLEFEGKVTEENLTKFAKAERGLRVLYAVHLNAKKLDLPENFGCFMRASVPDYLSR